MELVTIVSSQLKNEYLGLLSKIYFAPLLDDGTIMILILGAI